MTSSLDPVAVYGALAAVAAITAALQTTALFASYADVAAIETKYDSSTASTQPRTAARSSAKSSLKRSTVLNVPGAIVNGCVIAAWGDVTLARATNDWVLTLPWVGVLVTFLFLVGAGLSLRGRLVAVRDATRQS
jgi:hypothetical protein